MPTFPADTGLDVLPQRFRQPLEACDSGELPPNVALMRLMIGAKSADEIDRAVSYARKALIASDPIDRLASLWLGAKSAFETVKSVLTLADHQNVSSEMKWTRIFDELAEVSLEAGVALYSLGSPTLLDLATASLVNKLSEWGLLGKDRTVLDLGCGIGRVCAALASEVRAVVGTDVSGKMLQTAQRRCAGFSNVVFAKTPGRDLAMFADETFDLVLAVDSFPYIVLAGEDVASAHIHEARRVLKTGGALVAFNYAYGIDAAASADAFSRHAGEAGLAPIRIGTRDLDWWDGITYFVRRTG